MKCMGIVKKACLQTIWVSFNSTYFLTDPFLIFFLSWEILFSWGLWMKWEFHRQYSPGKEQRRAEITLNALFLFNSHSDNVGARVTCSSPVLDLFPGLELLVLLSSSAWSISFIFLIICYQYTLFLSWESLLICSWFTSCTIDPWLWVCPH